MARVRVGFCLTGPKAGETVSRDEYAFNVRERISAMNFYPLPPVTDFVPFKTVTYFHVPFGVRGNEDGADERTELGFFTPDRPWSASEIMAELMKGYRERAAIESKRWGDPGLDHYVKRALGAEQ